MVVLRRRGRVVIRNGRGKGKSRERRKGEKRERNKERSE